MQALRDCRVGDCNVKLGAEAVERFRTEVAWQAADAHAQAHAMMRRLTLDYVEQSSRTATSSSPTSGRRSSCSVSCPTQRAAPDSGS